MITVPDEIKGLFELTSISKNFRVHFVNGEYRDLVNADLVSESVSFTESINSSNEFKFGLLEGSTLSFKTYFNENIKGLKIFCEIEIDISSLDASTQSQYGETSDDVPYVYYAVPYGYFLVDSCKLSENNGVREVVAYQQKWTNLDDTKFVPTMELAKFIWGYTDRYDKALRTSPLKVKLNSAKFALCCFSDMDFLSSPVTTYNENSSIFNYGQSYSHDQMNPTIKVRMFGTRNAAGTQDTIYKVLVKGRVIVFGDNYKKVWNYNSLHAEVNFTKQLKSTQFLDTEYMYNLSWQNSLKIPEKKDFKDKYVYAVIGDELANLCSPCIRFCEWGTHAAAGDRYYTSSTTRMFNSSPAFPVNVIENLNYGSIGSQSRTEGYNGLNIRDTHTNNFYISDYITHVTQSYPDNYSNTRPDLMLDTCNSNGHQQYIDIPVSGDTNYSVNIDPDILSLADSSIDVTDNLTYPELIDNRSTHSTTTRNRHIEFCIPTEIIIIKWTGSSIGYDNIYDHIADASHRFSLSDISQAYGQNVPTFQKLDVNEFLHPSLKAYDVSGQTAPDLVFDTYCLAGSPDVRSIPEDDIGVAWSYFYDDNYCTNIQARFNYVYTVNNPVEVKEENFIEKQVNSSTAQSIINAYSELQAMLLKFARVPENTVERIPFDVELNAVYPADDLYPANNLYPAFAGVYYSTSLWRRLFIDEVYNIAYTKVSCNITLESEDGSTYQKKVSVDIDFSDRGIVKSEDKELSLSNNWLLQHSSIDEESALTMLEQIAVKLKLLHYLSVTMTATALPYIEPGDDIRILMRRDGQVYYTKVFRHTISGIQSLIDSIENR